MDAVALAAQAAVGAALRGRGARPVPEAPVWFAAPLRSRRLGAVLVLAAGDVPEAVAAPLLRPVLVAGTVADAAGVPGAVAGVGAVAPGPVRSGGVAGPVGRAAGESSSHRGASGGRTRRGPAARAAAGISTSATSATAAMMACRRCMVRSSCRPGPRLSSPGDRRHVGSAIKTISDSGSHASGRRESLLWAGGEGAGGEGSVEIRLKRACRARGGRRRLPGPRGPALAEGALEGASAGRPLAEGRGDEYGAPEVVRPRLRAVGGVPLQVHRTSSAAGRTCSPRLREVFRAHPVVTLLYAARDEEHNNAVALREFLEDDG